MFPCNLTSCTRIIFFLVLVPLDPQFSNPSTASARYPTFTEAEQTLHMYADSGMPGSGVSTAAEWNRWIRQHDQEVRARVDRGTEDSISNLILYGTSFTARPPLEGFEDAITPTGEVAGPARLRIRDLASALRIANDDERVQFVRIYLKRKGVVESSIETFLSRNLIRFANEQLEYQKKLEAASRTNDPGDTFSARGTLYESRGLSVDTSLLPNFALEETLRSLFAKGCAEAGKRATCRRNRSRSRLC